MLDFLSLQATSPNPTLLTVTYTVLIAFLLSTAVGLTYVKTFRGLSYSRNYVQALIFGAIVAATVMQAIGDSLARGLGMIGALAIIRFRTNFKDPRDIIFIFASLAAGIACGVGAYTVALVGTAGFVLIAVILYLSPLGQTSYFDGMLRFNMEQTPENRLALEQALQAHCRSFALITMRDMQQGSRLDYAYHVKLKKSVHDAALLDDLRHQIGSIKGLSLMLQETTVEI
jgi:uncharacterized membrane protein YhiD involved in acid resistance